MMLMASAPVHTIIETPAFTSQARKIGVSRSELDALYDVYASNSSYGEVMRRTGGLRKGRIARDHGGKSGGYRVFSFFADASHPVFLLWVIDKTDDTTLTDAQEGAFKKVINTLKEALK